MYTCMSTKKVQIQSHRQAVTCLWAHGKFMTELGLDSVSLVTSVIIQLPRTACLIKDTCLCQRWEGGELVLPWKNPVMGNSRVTSRSSELAGDSRIKQYRNLAFASLENLMNGEWNPFSLLGIGARDIFFFFFFFLRDISKCVQGRNNLHWSAVGYQPLESMTLNTHSPMRVRYQVRRWIRKCCYHESQQLAVTGELGYSQIQKTRLIPLWTQDKFSRKSVSFPVENFRNKLSDVWSWPPKEAIGRVSLTPSF